MIEMDLDTAPVILVEDMVDLLEALTITLIEAAVVLILGRLTLLDGNVVAELLLNGVVAIN